eukprot:PhM_4_TR18444/c0_g2_i9/m.72786
MMLRHRFILPNTTRAGNHSSTTTCNVSTSLFTPALSWQRRFCSSSSAHGVVEFTGDYVDRRGRKRPWSAVKVSGELKPVNDWRWYPFCTQFTDLVHSSSLELPEARTMEPAMQVFAKLDIDVDVLRAPSNSKGVRPDEHCNIEGVMKANGFMPQLDIRTVLAASEAERNRMLAEHSRRRDAVNDILKNNQNMVLQLSTALREEDLPANPEPGYKVEGKIDECSRQFLQLCGFGQVPFFITAQRPRFRIFNSQCSAKSDQYVVLTP